MLAADADSFLSPVLQAMRTLSWKPHLGSVTLDVELEDRTLTNLTVSPIHAAIILHFQEKSTESFGFSPMSCLSDETINISDCSNISHFL